MDGPRKRRGVGSSRPPGPLSLLNIVVGVPFRVPPPSRGRKGLGHLVSEVPQNLVSEFRRNSEDPGPVETLGGRLRVGLSGPSRPGGERRQRPRYGPGWMVHPTCGKEDPSFYKETQSEKFFKTVFG